MSTYNRHTINQVDQRPPDFRQQTASIDFIVLHYKLYRCRLPSGSTMWYGIVNIHLTDGILTMTATVAVLTPQALKARALHTSKLMTINW